MMKIQLPCLVVAVALQIGFIQQAVRAETLRVQVSPGNSAHTEADGQKIDSDEIDLGGGLIELLITGSIKPRTHSITLDTVSKDTIPAVLHQMSRRPYDGPLPAGTVGINVRKREVYHVTSMGFIDIYSNVADTFALAHNLTKQRFND